MVSLLALDRLPTAAALLVVSAILGRNAAEAHVLPRATPRPMPTLPHHQLDVVPWPLAFPTPTPFIHPPNRDLRRQESLDAIFNTICGYIGGNEDLPATCSAGSHCVLAAGQGAIGCCPDSGPCTTGVFTGCVDVNSSPQTEIDPYVYTCSGANVCYQNVFDGGYSQFGCGTASDMATSVRAVAGTATVVLTSVSVPFTATAETLETPTTIGSRTSSETGSTTSSTSSSLSETTSSTSSETSTSSTSRSTSSSSSTATTTATPGGNAPTAAPAVEGSVNGADNMIAIVSGTLCGVALLVAVLAIALFFWRRHKGNKRDGPGTTGPQNLPPTEPSGFTPAQTQDERFDTIQPPPMTQRYEDTKARVAPIAIRTNPFNDLPPQPTAVGGSRFYEHDRTPLRRPESNADMDGFRGDYNETADRVSNNTDDDDLQTSYHGQSSEHPPDQRGSSGSDRPLWQQNRRHSRSLMWI